MLNVYFIVPVFMKDILSGVRYEFLKIAVRI